MKLLAEQLPTKAFGQALNTSTEDACAPHASTLVTMCLPSTLAVAKDNLVQHAISLGLPALLAYLQHLGQHDPAADLHVTSTASHQCTPAEVRLM